MKMTKVRIGLIAALYLLHGNMLTAGTLSRNDILLSATSPFEDLAEYALSGNQSGVKHALQAYSRQAAGVGKALNAKAREKMDALVGAIGKAERQGNNEAVALNAVEAYRVLVESLDAKDLAVPQQVSLLDYAGFKFEVILHTRPIDWLALKKTAEEAGQNWAAIQPRVADDRLHDVVDAAVAGMYKASAGKNAEMAAFAAQIDLAIVDLLEAYFAQSPQ